MLDRLIDTSKAVAKPQSWADAASDLEVDKIFISMTIPDEGAELEGEGLVRLLTADAEEIAQRSAMLQDLLKIPDAQARLTKCIAGIARLRYMTEQAKNASEELYRVSAGWHGARQYIDCVAMLGEELLGDTSFEAPRLLQLKRQVAALSQSAEFQNDAQILKAAQAWFQLPQDVYVGFNFVSGAALTASRLRRWKRRRKRWSH